MGSRDSSEWVNSAPQNNPNINFIALLSKLVVQNGREDGGHKLEQHVNDRPINMHESVLEERL